jgi:hypothetical protein
MPVQPIDVTINRVLAKKLAECSIEELRAIEAHLIDINALRGNGIRDRQLNGLAKFRRRPCYLHCTHAPLAGTLFLRTRNPGRLGRDSLSQMNYFH